MVNNPRKKKTYVHPKTYMGMFTTVSFVLSPEREGTNELWFIQTPEQQEEGIRLSFPAAIWTHAKCIFLREKSQNHFLTFGKRQTGCQSQEGVEESWTGRGRTGKLGMPAARMVHIELSSPCTGKPHQRQKGSDNLAICLVLSWF